MISPVFLLPYIIRAGKSVCKFYKKSWYHTISDIPEGVLEAFSQIQKKGILLFPTILLAITQKNPKP